MFMQTGNVYADRAGLCRQGCEGGRMSKLVFTDVCS